MTTRTRLFVLLITTPVLAFALVGGFLGKASAGEDDSHFKVFQDVIQLILGNYVEEVDSERIMEGAMRGLSEGLDPESAYLDAKLTKAVESHEPLPPAGVGLELTRQYYLRVIAARDGSPAARAGLLPGDHIRAINGKPTRDLSVFEGMRMLRGEPGSKVSLTIIRGNAAEPHSMDLVREKLSGAALTAREIAPKVGYVRIAAFEANGTDALRGRITELTTAGAERLIVDVRRTAEGPLQAGIDAAKLFVSAGTLVARETRSSPKDPITASGAGDTIRVPVVLLVDSGTAGAAELFAAALAGNRRAELIGERTIGRAADQKLVKLPDGRGLWLTWARYLTPSGEAIHGRGLAPDVEVESPDVEFGAPAPTTDPILDKALEKMTTKTAA